jgi:hypothetical protein
MGTPQVPDSKTAGAQRPQVLEDSPRLGLLMWLMLICLLVPPAVVTYLAQAGFTIPHQTLWVILLGVPFFVILFTLPRKYQMNQHEIRIVGFYYRVKIPLEDVVSLQPVSAAQALVHPGSVFCTDPGRAWKLTRRSGRTFLISPRVPAPFVERIESLSNSEGESA